MGYARVIKLMEEVHKSEYLAHETKRDNLIKFFFLLVILFSYFLFITNEYGAEFGLAITALTWSFFVLCTPVADAGFLVDFPVRVFANVRMFTTEVFVWALAIGMNLLAVFFFPEIYAKTFLLRLFKHILLNPYPFWGIIALSGVGTFLSIFFGDELLDIMSYSNRTEHARHKLKHDLVVFLFIIAGIVILYDFLLKELGVDVPF